MKEDVPLEEQVDAVWRWAERDGNPDADGKRIALPFAERTPSPVVYHLSANFPEELLDAATATAEGWDRAYRRTVAAAQNDGDTSSMDEVRPMFVLCHNPVKDTPVYPADPAYGADCGEVGDEVRIGDVRYSVMYWVNNPQMSGPLGYGPSAADPETGEIISGTAHVYGASVDSYAQYAVDVIRFANGDLTPEDLESTDYIRDQIEEYAEEDPERNYSMRDVRQQQEYMISRIQNRLPEAVLPPRPRAVWIPTGS